MDETINIGDTNPGSEEEPKKYRRLYRKTGRKSRYEQRISKALESLSSFSMPAFAKALLRKFGGEEGLAEKAWEIYNDPESNAATRRGILDMVFRAFAKASEDLDMGTVSQEDLEITAIEILKKIGAKRKKKRPPKTNDKESVNTPGGN